MTDDELGRGDAASGVPEAHVARAIGVRGSVEAYEPPAIAVLGTLAELTGGPVGAGGDVNGMVISF
jgi:hypothetical protein